jgi:hypothetical protein
VDLRQRQMRVLKVALLRAVTPGEFVQDHFGDLHFGAANPGNTIAFEFNLRGEDGSR